jgi:hypothetical protein
MQNFRVSELRSSENAPDDVPIPASVRAKRPEMEYRFLPESIIDPFEEPFHLLSLVRYSYFRNLPQVVAYYFGKYIFPEIQGRSSILLT